MDTDSLKNRFRDKRIIFYVLTFFILVFIWSNSLDDPEKSYSRSKKVMDFVSGILAGVFGENHRITLFFISHVRKIAHFVEYMFLGSAVTFAMKMSRKTRLQNIYNSLSFAVITAVVDEYIQIYTYRGSSVRDVVIDFSGYFMGTLLAAFTITAYYLFKLIKNKDK